MGRNVRTIVAIGSVGCAGLALTLLGCTSSIGPVRATQQMDEGHASMPDSTIEQLTECMAKHGKPLGPSYHTYHPVIQVEKDNLAQKSIDDDIPITAYDFRQCTRDALLAMTMPETRYWKTAEVNNDANTGSKYVASPALVAGAALVFCEVVLEAGAYTIAFAVAVEVVDTAGKEVAEAAKRWRRKPNLGRCLDAAAGGDYMWAELCRAMTNSQMAAQCWQHATSNEVEKRNMCYRWFGN